MNLKDNRCWRSRGMSKCQYAAHVGLSRRLEEITEALWGTRVSPGTVSNLNSEPVNATGSREKANDLRQDRGMAEPVH